MTEMVYGAVPVQRGEPILPKWWRTIDKWAMSCILILFAVGLLLGLASSPPLAAKNGFDPFHYVQRQAFFGCCALVAMMLTSMMSPMLVRRLAVIGFLFAFVALALVARFWHGFWQRGGALVFVGLCLCAAFRVSETRICGDGGMDAGRRAGAEWPARTHVVFCAVRYNCFDVGVAAGLRAGLLGPVRFGV